MGFEIRPKGSGNGFFPLPTVDSINPNKLNHNEVKTLTVTGSYFTSATTVSVTGLTVNSTTFINDNEIQFEVVGNTTDGFYDVVITNESGNITITNGVQVELSVWVDLRLGGDTFTSGNAAGNDIRFRSGMTMNRDSNGMFFTGSNPWSSWVKFESLGWNRGDGVTMQMIFTRPTSFMMIGIGSTGTNETNTAQYAQAENEAYFNSSTNFWGLYGNSGTPGSAGNQGDGLNISGGSGVYKIKFENDGGVGSTFTLYELPSSNDTDWDDESNILKTITVAGSLNPDEPNLMPFIIPRADTQRFLAIKTE